MKHIKRKFLSEVKLTDEQLKLLEQRGSIVNDRESAKNVKVPKDMSAILITENKTGINAFIYKERNSQYFIPEPDPVLIYFNNAQANLRQIEASRTEMFNKLNVDGFVTTEIKHSLYQYFGSCSAYVIFLFTAIEATMNKSIPPSHEYRVDRPSRSELYNFEQIQKHLGFDEKMTKVLRQLTNKDFSKDHPKVYQHISNLKEFRDSIVHTKTESKDNTPYGYIFKKALTFDYVKTIYAVRDFINYYQPGLIEQCDCGMDF